MKIGASWRIAPALGSALERHLDAVSAAGIGKKHLTRLERLMFRLQAQHACLGWAFGEIAPLPGIVFEMGLGHGRTYDHLRTHLPARDIFVFDREVDAFPDCTPPADRLLLGDIAETLTAAGDRFAGQVILAHIDMGSYDDAQNVAMSRVIGRLLPAVLAPGAIVLCDLPLELRGTRQLPLPSGVRDGIYFVYRNDGA